VCCWLYKIFNKKIQITERGRFIVADLQKGKSYVTLTGKVKINERTFSGEQTSERTGYKYSRINLGIETAEGNVVYAEMMGGYAPSKPVIFAMSKEDNSPLQINFADRLNEAVVDSVADFRLHKVGLERDDQDKLVVKKFLSPMDVHDYLQENLKDGMEVTVKGSFQFSEYKDETQRKIQIQNIFLAYQKKNDDGTLEPVNRQATFVQSLLLNEDSFKKITKADAEAGEVVVSAMAVDYVSKKDGKEVKKNMPFALPIVVKINKENPEMTEKILNALFNVKKGKVRELAIEGLIVEGFEKEEVSSKDIELSAEIKELIAMGLYSEEEAKAKMTVRGNKVSKLVFTRPFLQKDKDDATKLKIDLSDDKYTTDDLFVQIDAPKEDPIDVADEGSTGGDDSSWMSALGI
jgi:hypothetical protein